ncbi:MAG: diacylglycerol/lipid kinase family protein [Saprospiraceae bacterium]|jgi:diacylglycerol kinase (ATP)
MSSKQKIYFIINPKSGYKKKEDVPALIKSNLDLSKFEYEYRFTESRGHAALLASEAVANAYDVVVACGGDGTVNEVASSLVDTDVLLGIIPFGSGNGFAMHIGMGRNTKRAILKLNECVPQVIDSCTVNNSFFLNLAGVGFDALIAYRAENDEKRGLQMYLSMVSKEMARFKAERFKVKLDGETLEGSYTTIAVANSAMYGYNFTIAPLAELTDGLFDVVFVKDAPLLRTIGASWRMLNKSLYKSPLVEVKKSREVLITAERPYYFHVDGESNVFEKELHFKVIPKSIKVLFPMDSKILN